MRLRLHRRRPGLSEETLVGRDAELQELRDAALRAAAWRHGWVGLIGGEPGIGKTRLAAECADGLARDGFGCAWVSCPEDDAVPPFWVWDQLLCQLDAGGALRAGADESDPALARFLLFDTITAGIRQAAGGRPLLLVIDDLHWADQGSIRLLAAIRSALATLPAVILGTYRDTEPIAAALSADVGPERTFILGGLAPGELGASVRMATGSDVPDALLAGLHARTAGNPFFAAEVVRFLRAEGRLYTSAQLPAGLLPDTVRAVLERRLARLPAQVTELLRAAALLGDELDPPLLAEVTGEPLTVVAAALATAQAVRVTGPARFAHPLVREVLQARLGPVDRLRWHTRIGELLARRYRAGTADPAAAARHLVAAAELGGQAGPAVEFARLAAADAVRRTGYEDAARLLTNALPLASTGSDRSVLLCELGEAAVAAGDQDRARKAYAEAAELARRTARPELLAAAALGMTGGRGGFEIDLCDPDRVTVLTEALRAQPQGDSAARTGLLGRLSLALAFTEAAAEQRESLSAEAVAMARRLGDSAVLAAALAARCDAVSDPDHVAERRAAAAEIIKLARAGGDRTGEMLGRRLLVVALAQAADWPAADAEISAYDRQARQLAQPRLVWYVPLWRGARALMDGDHAQAEAYANELDDLAGCSGGSNARLLTLVQRYVRLMSEDRADELAGDFAAIVALLPDDPAIAVCARAFFNAHRGQLAQARADLDRVAAGEVPRDGEWLAKYVQAAVAAVLADHRTAAELAYRVLTPYARQCAIEGILAGSWGSVAAHLGLLARYLGRAGESGAHFAMAAELDAAAGAALAARTRKWAGADDLAPDGTAVFHLEGKVWTLRYAGRTVRLPDSKGLRDLAVLITRPGERTHVSELVGVTGLPGSDLGPVADRRALAAYRERLRRIDAELDPLGEGSPEAGAVQRERDALLAELSAAAGLGGGPRTAGSPAERMRKAVTYRIRHAISQVACVHPELGRHLRASVRTGTWCGYSPEQPVDWHR
ncbi:MAG: AAA family ATPase [Streptosporangiaceae bacterium]